MRKNDHKTYINTLGLGVPHYDIAMGIFVPLIQLLEVTAIK
jgi:hypothetical protein